MTDLTSTSHQAAARPSSAPPANNRWTEAALLRHKLEGLDLAVRARLLALAVIAVLLPFLNPSWDVLYYEFLLLCLALVGLAQRRVGRVGRSGMELALLFADLALMTFALAFPNPFSTDGWPPEMIYRFGNFSYFFVILAAGTLAYSWRTIMAIGNWTAAMWLIGAVAMWWFSTTDAALDEMAQAAFGHDAQMLDLLNPNSLNFDIRVQEVVVFMIVAAILSVTVNRFDRLLHTTAALERTRENLSRYFSPNVVDELARSDEQPGRIRTHDVAVLFVDIVGFTAHAATRPPGEVIGTLREFHARMEREVFAHHGTLDKYLGDGLMATFGTPFAGERDASNALACARAMIAAMDAWNAERVAAGAAPIRASFGLHFGPVVLGDIGGDRLEFAVIGNTVNLASRLEEATRALGVRLVVSGDLHDRVRVEDAQSTALDGLEPAPPQAVRGIEGPVPVWTV